jgi:hypothetical protein
MTAANRIPAKDDSVKKIEVEVLSEAVNAPVLQLRSREFPGVLIQGDTLREEAHSLASASIPDRAEAEHLARRLRDFVDVTSER